jgi:hypothetical protein
MDIKRGDRLNFGIDEVPEYLTVHSILGGLALVAWDEDAPFFLQLDLLKLLSSARMVSP